MIKVTLGYMRGTIKETFTCESLYVEHSGRIWYRTFGGTHDTGWTFDGNVTIETEEAVFTVPS